MLGAKLGIGPYVQRLQGELDRVAAADVQAWADWLYEAWADDIEVRLHPFRQRRLRNDCHAHGRGPGQKYPQACRSQSTNRSGRLKVLSLTEQPGLDLWPWATDVGYDRQIFVQQLMNFGRPGDLLIAISGSGNSPNVLAAVDWANRHGLKTFGLTGYEGGKLKRVAWPAAACTCRWTTHGDVVESIHLCLFHWVLNDVFARINHEGPSRSPSCAEPGRGLREFSCSTLEIQNLELRSQASACF